MTNLTHAALDHERRIEALEQRLEEAQANLIAAGVANIVLTRVLVARNLLAEDSWRASLDDVSSSCLADLKTLPINSPHAQQIRAFAEGLILGNLNEVGDAIAQWDAEGRPSLVDDIGALN